VPSDPPRPASTPEPSRPSPGRPQPPGGPPPPKKAPSPGVGWAWWLVLMVLLAWNTWSFLLPGHPAAKVPYSTFLSQIRADNVVRVKIVGDQISGSFNQAIAWPPPEASAAQSQTKSGASGPAAASATPAATTSIAAKGAAPARTSAAKAAGKVPPTYTSFETTFPQEVGDPTLMPLLEGHHVVIDVQSPSAPWFMVLLTDGLPLLLLIGILFWMGRQAARSQGGMLGLNRSKARRYAPNQPKVKFTDVAGADEAKAELEEVVDFLRQPLRYHQIGARIPRGVLLVGSPGTGKTLMARAVAGEADVPFFHISGSEFVEMFVGVGASRVRDLFEQAKQASPAIVFIDEIDAVGRRRGAGLGMVNDEREQTLNQLLAEMDGFDERQEVIILAATNRPDVLDPALLRPGRFDRQVTVPLPDRNGREGILRLHSRQLQLAPDVDLTTLARTATGLSGADLANLCNEAALVAARQRHVEVTMADFDEAWDKVLLGRERPPLHDPQERRVVAYHESGHALVAWRTPAADPVHKVTIIPHGQALGVTEQLPEDDRHNYTRAWLMARVDVMLGGRCAEEVAVGDISTGAENDLVQATRLVRRMLTRWGMGSLGPVAFQVDEEQPFLGYQLSQGRDYSEATAARIDEDLERMLGERHDAVRRLLNEERDALDRLAARLLRDETVSHEELNEILGPRPQTVGSVEVA
jgi:cell division protease FtsH